MRFFAFTRFSVLGFRLGLSIEPADFVRSPRHAEVDERSMRRRALRNAVTVASGLCAGVAVALQAVAFIDAHQDPVLYSTAAVLNATRINDDSSAAQLHPIAACKAENDVVCQRQWYNEYRAGIVDEYRFWKSFLSDAEVGNPIDAQRDLNLAIARHAYRHRTWDFFRGPTIQGVPDDKLEAVTWGCRTAIINLKYWLIGLTRANYHNGTQDRADYMSSALQCETTARD